MNILENPLKQPPKKRLFGNQPKEDFKPVQKDEKETENLKLLYDFVDIKLNKESYELAEAITDGLFSKLNKRRMMVTDDERERIAKFLRENEKAVENGKIKYLRFTTIAHDLPAFLENLVEPIIKAGVEELDMTFEGLGPGSATNLAEIVKGGHLVKLELLGNSLADQGAMKIAEVLPGSSLQELDLNGNGIRDEGGMAIVKAIPDSNLKALWLGENYMSTKVMEMLIDVCKKKKVKLYLS